MIQLLLSSYKETVHGIRYNLGKYLTRLNMIGLGYSLLISSQYLLDTKLTLYNDSLITTVYLEYAELFIILLSIILLVINSSNLDKTYGRLITEYPLISLFTIIGSILLIKSNNLMLMFIAIELQSYSLYTLCVIYNETENSTKAGLKYFFLGGLASILILLGIAIIYAESGLLNLEQIKVLINYKEFETNVNLGILIMLVGYLFKIGAAPFHSWSPDVYNEVPTKITAWISVLPKVGLLIFVGILFEFINDSYNSILILAGMLSILVGAIGGVSQNNFKRLLGYSGIANVGYMLLTLGCYTSYIKEGFVMYLLQYSLVSANIFVLLILLGIYAAKFNNTASTLSPIRLISDFKNLFKYNPVLIILLSISLFSLIGIPPLVGFYSKYWLIQEILANGFIYPALILIVGSVISSYYYLNVIRTLYLTDNQTSNDLLINQYDIALSPILSYIAASLSVFTIFMFSDFDSILQGIHLISSVVLN